MTIEHSAFVCCIRKEDKPIAMARVTWDHGYTVFISDVIVKPEYQKQGLGRLLMEKIMDYLHSQLKTGYRFMVCLMAAKGKEEFYKKFGFIDDRSLIIGIENQQFCEISKGGTLSLKKETYKYIQHGFEAILYDAENGDGRLLIVIQGLKGLDLPEKYAQLFSEKGYSTLAMSYYGGEGQKKNIRAIPLEQFQAAADEMKKHGYKRIGIYGNSKGGGMALLAASVVSDISLVIAASAFGHIMQGTGKPSEDPCKAMVSFRGEDFPYVEKGKLFSDFLKRCVKEKNIRLLYFFDEWDKRGTEKNEIPVERIGGDILLLTSTHDESVPAKRDAELLCKRLKRENFRHNYRHINSEIGSHNLGYFPVNNNMLPREKKYPNECQRAREETLDLIIRALDAWCV